MKTYPLILESVGEDTYEIASKGHHNLQDFDKAVKDFRPNWSMAPAQHCYMVRSVRSGYSEYWYPCEPYHPKAVPFTWASEGGFRMTDPKAPSNLDQEIESAAEALVKSISRNPKMGIDGVWYFKAGAAFVREKLEVQLGNVKAMTEHKDVIVRALERSKSHNTELEAQIKTLVEAIDSILANSQTIDIYNWGADLRKIRSVLEAHRKAR